MGTFQHVLNPQLELDPKGILSTHAFFQKIKVAETSVMHLRNIGNRHVTNSQPYGQYQCVGLRSLFLSQIKSQKYFENIQK